MPQRRYYGGGYGQNEEYLQELGGPNYDPYSKRANIGLAIRNTINQIVAKRKEEREKAKKEAQEEWAKKLEERKLDIEERRARAYERGQEATPIVERVPVDIQAAMEVQKSNPEKYPTVGHVLAEWHTKPTPKTVTPKQPSATIPRLSDTPQYKQASYIKAILGRLNSERGRLKTAGTKLDPNTPEGKEVRWRANNLEMAIGKLNHQLGQIALGEPLPEPEFAKSIAIGSDIEKVQTQGEFWGTGNIQSSPKPSGLKTIKEADIPEGTEIKQLPNGKEAVRINGVVYEVIK